MSLRASQGRRAFLLASASACIVCRLALPAIAAPRPEPPSDEAFKAFIAGLWPDAQKAGIRRETFDRAFASVHLDPSIIAHTRKQAEFERSIRDYLAASVSASQVAKGRALAARWSQELGVIEQRYGVDRKMLVALWGLESGYGAGIGGEDVISALANLAFVGFRDGLFRDELISALVVLQEGNVERSEMKGSWAGAMGQAQFMPSSFLKFAVSYDGSARKDIWTRPPDVLASIANFLKGNDWRPGLRWGFEVILPEGFNYRLSQADFESWRHAGVVKADGGPMPSAGEALLFFPAGWRGPAFLITANFFVLKAYNTSDAYALSAGVLADRIAGGAGLHAPWPAVIDGLDHEGLLEAQQRLNALSLYDDKLDGRLGPSLRAATHRFQADHGLIADGFPTPALLAKLRAAH